VTAGSERIVQDLASFVIARDSPRNETNATFTNVEGEWDEVMQLIKAGGMKVAGAALRVSVVVKVDRREGIHDALHTKVAAVERRLHTV